MTDRKKSRWELYQNMEYHLMKDIQPSCYLNEIYEDPDFQKYPFDIYKVENVNPKYHPEGNVWNHTLLVVNEAARVRNKSKNPLAFMWAAMLHDIGKARKTRNRNGKITAYDHDKAGAVLACEFLTQFAKEQAFSDEVSQLIRYHMQILYVVNGLRFADVEGMKQHTDINEVALLGLCDRLGRAGSRRKEEENNIRIFLQACNSFSANNKTRR